MTEAAVRVAALREDSKLCTCGTATFGKCAFPRFEKSRN